MPKKPASSGRPRVSQGEATRRLVDATVKLAGSRLMSEISVGMIADEAGLEETFEHFVVHIISYSVYL